MTSSHPSMTQAPGVMMLRLLRFDCLQVESMQAEAAALRAQLASSQEMAAEEQQQRVGLQADLSAVQAQLTSSREQVAQAEERLQVAGLRLRQEVAASREQAKSLRAQLADAEQKRCADELRLQEQAARHQQEVAGLGAEAAQLARNNSEAERWLQGQVAMLEEKVNQLTRELAAARADAADEQEQQLGSEEALMQHEAAHQEQMAAVQATPHQQLQSWQQSLEEREAAHRQEVALLKGRIWEATGAGILAAQEQRHRSDQHEAAALRKQREQLRAACQEELRSTQRSLEAAADSRLQKQAAEHQQQEAAPMQQMDQHLAALEKQRQQQETAYKSHLAGAQSKLTELLEQAAQEQVAELQQALAPLQAELQRQTQRADRYAFEAATQMALRREAAQPAAFSQQRPDRRQAPPPLLICGNREPVDEEMADADSSIVPSLPAAPSPQGRAGVARCLLGRPARLQLCCPTRAHQRRQPRRCTILHSSSSMTAWSWTVLPACQLRWGPPSVDPATWQAGVQAPRPLGHAQAPRVPSRSKLRQGSPTSSPRLVRGHCRGRPRCRQPGPRLPAVHMLGPQTDLPLPRPPLA